MKPIRIQWVAIKSQGETKEALKELVNNLKVVRGLSCRAEDIREVDVPLQGAGYVIDVIVEKSGMNYRDLLKEIKAVCEPYAWCIE